MRKRGLLFPMTLQKQPVTLTFGGERMSKVKLFNYTAGIVGCVGLLLGATTNLIDAVAMLLFPLMLLGAVLGTGYVTKYQENFS
jgi:hypothetical protein